MTRVRNPNRDKSFNLYKEKEGKITPKEISEVLGEKINNIRAWKNLDEWDIKLGFKKKVGAPKGNTNAKGNKGGSAPKGNLNAFKHGENIPAERFQSKKFLSKYLPKVTKSIMEELEENQLSSLDILWTSIDLHFAAILRSQKIMYVKNQKDMTKEEAAYKYGDTSSSKEYEIQFAWDKQERFITSQSKAMATLEKMIKTYEELLHKNWDLATEEQRARIDVLKSKLTGNEREPIKIEFVRASARNERS